MVEDRELQIANYRNRARGLSFNLHFAIRILQFAFLLSLLSLLSIFAPVAAAASDPAFELHTAAGATTTGPLKELDEDWTLRLKGSKASRVKGGEVVSLRRVGLPLPPPPKVEQVLLANGSRLPGSVVSIADDRLVVRPAFPVRLAGGSPWRLPQSGVVAVWLAAPAGEARPAALLRRLARESRSRDVLLLRNGDRVEGQFKGLSDGKFTIATEGNKTREVDRDRVAAVAFNTELVSRARARGLHAQLVLANGARLLIAAAALLDSGETLRARLPTGDRFDVPLDQVRAIDLRGGCVVSLSDLKPARYEHTPYFGVRWPYVADGSVTGRALRLGGSTYDKGLGLHPRSRLTFAVPLGSRTFEALVGLDDRTGRRGRARVAVLLDGKPADVGRAGDLGADDKPLRVRLDVSRAKELTLVVDFGRFGDVQADVDWVDARYIKDAKETR